MSQVRTIAPLSAAFFVALLLIYRLDFGMAVAALPMAAAFVVLGIIARDFLL
jgi:hypothetical protein